MKTPRTLHWRSTTRSSGKGAHGKRLVGPRGRREIANEFRVGDHISTGFSIVADLSGVTDLSQHQPT